MAASNHYHLILKVESSKQLADFMAYFNGNAAREISRLTGWGARVWSRRFQAIVVSNEEAAQVEIFRYVLSHGVKENLVERLRQWPGLHCVREVEAPAHGVDEVRLPPRWQARTRSCV